MDRQTELLYQLSMLTRNKNQTSKNTNITQDITIVQWESLVAMACPAVRFLWAFVIPTVRLQKQMRRILQYFVKISHKIF